MYFGNCMHATTFFVCSCSPPTEYLHGAGVAQLTCGRTSSQSALLFKHTESASSERIKATRETMSKRGLSVAEKRAKMLDWFHESQSFFQLKDVERLCSAEKGRSGLRKLRDSAD